MRVPLFWQSTFLLRTDKHRNLASKKTCECLKEVYLGTWERFHLLLTCPKIHGCDSQAWICKNVQMWDKSMSHRWKSFMNKWKTRIFTPHLLHSVWCESLCRTPSSCLWARAAGGERGGEGGEREGEISQRKRYSTYRETIWSSYNYSLYHKWKNTKEKTQTAKKRLFFRPCFLSLLLRINNIVYDTNEFRKQLIGASNVVSERFYTRTLNALIIII